MAQKGVQLHRESFSCSVCLDLLKDPVTLPCGHSYCMDCIQGYWGEAGTIPSCPQCRQTFPVRPVLVKNTILAALMEELKSSGLQAAPADHCYAGAEDVACDVCTGRKVKAFRSCLVCVASFCEQHLQPHYHAAAFQKHQLVEPSKKLQENMCSRHGEAMKMFCRTDQQCICFLCPVDEHRGHDTVSTAAERTERQRDLEESRQIIQQRIRDAEKDLELLGQEVKNLDVPAQQTEPEPTTKAAFSRYSRQLTLDPNTADTNLLLSEGNRKVTYTEAQQPYPQHPERFSIHPQVLSRESLTGRCYWEVETRGDAAVAVSYKNIDRGDWNESLFGENDKSWALYSFNNSLTLCHNKVSTAVPSPRPSRVGVYLDHTAGILSFYSVSGTRTLLLHRVQTTFTQPLLAGVWTFGSAELVEVQ